MWTSRVTPPRRRRGIEGDERKAKVATVVSARMCRGGGMSCHRVGRLCASGRGRQRRRGAGCGADSALGGYLAARHAQQAHDYAEAASFIDRSLADDPDNYDLLRRAFVLRLSEGRVEDAVDLAHRIVAHDGNGGLAGLVLLEQAIKTGDFDRSSENRSSDPARGRTALFRAAVARLDRHGARPGRQGGDDIAGAGDTRGLGPLKEIHGALIADLRRPDRPGRCWLQEDHRRGKSAQPARCATRRKFLRAP